MTGIHGPFTGIASGVASGLTVTIVTELVSAKVRTVKQVEELQNTTSACEESNKETM